jgi:hypothetical protein
MSTSNDEHRIHFGPLLLDDGIRPLTIEDSDLVVYYLPSISTPIEDNIQQGGEAFDEWRKNFQRMNELQWKFSTLEETKEFQCLKYYQWKNDTNVWERYAIYVRKGIWCLTAFSGVFTLLIRFTNKENARFGGEQALIFLIVLLTLIEACLLEKVPFKPMAAN